MRSKFTIFVLSLIFTFDLSAQTENHFLQKLKNYKIKPIVNLQLWSTYTSGMKVYNEETGQYEAVDDRLNTQLRRSRLGIIGQPYKNLKFNFTGALDLVGKDLLAGTQGGGNNGASPSFRIWNAFVQWKLMDKKDVLNLTAGYFAPQIGRESITSAFRSNSMEKSWSQNYLRRQLVGTGPGRALGINVGGLLLNENKKIGWGYDLGLFNPVYQSLNANSVGEKFSALVVGRTVLYFGDPEFKKYTISHKVNYMGKRNGLSIAFSGGYQGETVLFKKQVAIGADWLFNWKNLNIDGEWTFLNKSNERVVNNRRSSYNALSNTGYFRISYNLKMPKDRTFEPVFMMVQFNGPLDASEQSDAKELKAFAGKDYTFDVGFNYYLNPDLKLSLHYTFRDADAGDAEDGATFNNYFYQDGVGAIRRGNWLGLGFVAIF